MLVLAGRRRRSSPTKFLPTCNATAQDATTTRDQFLAANASDVSANSIQDISSHALVLTGEIDIAKSGSQSVSLYSDDGADLYVDGKLVANDDGIHPWQGVSTTSVIVCRLA